MDQSIAIAENALANPPAEIAEIIRASGLKSGMEAKLQVGKWIKHEDCNSSNPS